MSVSDIYLLVYLHLLIKSLDRLIVNFSQEVSDISRNIIFILVLLRQLALSHLTSRCDILALSFSNEIQIALQWHKTEVLSVVLAEASNPATFLFKFDDFIASFDTQMALFLRDEVLSYGIDRECYL